MIDTLIMTVALSLPSIDSDREWAVNRPTRGSSRVVNTVTRAATPPPSVYRWASCVLDRESGGTFARRQSGTGALNGEGSGAAGRWQFMPNWRHGLPYMVKDRLVQFGMPKRQARQVRLYLSRLHYIHRYPGVYQDIGMLEVVERGGAFHWDGHTCGRP
jgi:hypothetical protein